MLIEQVPAVYVTAAVPGLTPVTFVLVPNVGLSVATAIGCTLHAPPVGALVSVVIEPTHTSGKPFIAMALTVITTLAEQPVDSV